MEREPESNRTLTYTEGVQRRTELSLLPEASCVPSGEKATHCTGACTRHDACGGGCANRGEQQWENVGNLSLLLLLLREQLRP